MKEIVEFGRNSESCEFDVVFVQFIVNLLDRNNVVEKEELLNIDELVIKTYDSVRRKP